jgi:hypothetical protein
MCTEGVPQGGTVNGRNWEIIDLNIVGSTKGRESLLHVTTRDFDHRDAYRAVKLQLCFIAIYGLAVHANTASSRNEESRTRVNFFRPEGGLTFAVITLKTR